MGMPRVAASSIASHKEAFREAAAPVLAIQTVGDSVLGGLWQKYL